MIRAGGAFLPVPAPALEPSRFYPFRAWIIMFRKKG